MKKGNNGNGDLKDLPASMREFDMAWKEFMDKKPAPKNKAEEKKQMEKFIGWYNNIRKQSDTGKTPNEMYKEIYGKNENRRMEFKLDENYEEPHELFDRADELLMAGEYHKSLEIVDRILEICPDDEEPLLMKAEILNDLKLYEESEKILKQLEERGICMAYCAFYRSHRAFLEGNFAKAVKYAQKSYELNNNNFDFVIEIANYFYLLKDKHYVEYVKRAESIDKKRLKKFMKEHWIEPKDIMPSFAFTAIGTIDKLLMEKNVEEALENIRFLENHEELFDKETKKIVRGLEIECLIINNVFDSAIERINRLIEIDKNNPHAYFYMAQILFQQGELEKADKMSDLCIAVGKKVNIEHFDFYYLKSLILKNMGRDHLEYRRKAEDLRKESIEEEENLK